MFQKSLGKRLVSVLCTALCFLLLIGTGAGVRAEEDSQAQGDHAKLLYMGHASLRITTAEGKVIYIDPFAGEGYEPAADLILITHDHYDHNAPDKVVNRTPDCRIITWAEALEGGVYQSFDLGYVTVESVEAYNANHDVQACVGYILTLSDGVTVYVSGDTSTTEQMPLLAEKNIDYAFFCCDGVYNMDMDEAAACASLVGAKHSIPYHMIAADAGLFDRGRAEQFDAPGSMILELGEEIDLLKDADAAESPAEEFDVSHPKWNEIEWDADGDGTKEEVEFEYEDLGDEAPSYILVTLYAGNKEMETMIDRAYGLNRITAEEDEEGPFLLIEYDIGDYYSHDAAARCILRLRGRELILEEA